MTFDSKVLTEQLIHETQEIGIELGYEEAQLLLEHLELVLQSNKSTNLTRIVEPQEAITLHIVDSLLLTPYISDDFVDMGSGAGYPGIALAIVSGKHTTLVESATRKAKYLQEFVDQLHLSDQVSVEARRVEEFALEHGEQIQVVVARALASSEVLVEYASPLLVRGGRLVVTKGPKNDDEDLLRNTLQLCGMERVSRETIKLPRGRGARIITVYEKVAEAQVKLPRRPGMATKRPLI